MKDNNKNNEGLVSIITLTYNKLEFITKLIDSVLMQDYPFLELIVSDDGSDNFDIDSLYRYIDKANNKNIDIYIFHHKYNIGLVKNMNSAIRNSRGEYICVLSGDDQFCNSHVVTDIVNEMRKKQCSLLMTGGFLCDSDLNVLCEYPKKKYRKYIYSMDTPHKQLMKHIVGMNFEMVTGSLMSYTRKLYDDMGGFDEAYDLYEDGPFVAKITSMGYKVDTNYEIPTRFIRTGGISANPTNPRMKKDLDLYHSRWLTNYDICKNSYEIRRLKYWKRVLSTDNSVSKALVCIFHPIFTFEYIKYFYIINIKRNC